MPAVGVTAGECAAAWSGVRRQVGIFEGQNRLQTKYALGGLHQKQLKVVTIVRGCGGVLVYPMQWPPSSPPPRPEAKVAIAGGNECWKQQLCLQCSIIVLFARQSSAVSRSRTLVRGVEQPKNTSATRQGKVRRESTSETAHTLPHPPLHTTLSVPSINFSPD